MIKMGEDSTYYQLAKHLILNHSSSSIMVTNVTYVM